MKKLILGCFAVLLFAGAALSDGVPLPPPPCKKGQKGCPKVAVLIEHAR